MLTTYDKVYIMETILRRFPNRIYLMNNVASSKFVVDFMAYYITWGRSFEYNNDFYPQKMKEEAKEYLLNHHEEMQVHEVLFMIQFLHDHLQSSYPLSIHEIYGDQNLNYVMYYNKVSTIGNTLLTFYFLGKNILKKIGTKLKRVLH